MNVLAPADAAYIAGVIEGDGHIGLIRRKRSWKKDGTRPTYLRPVIQIGQAKPLLLEHIQQLIGDGTIQPHSKRTFYNLRYYPTVLRQLIPQILPYLFIKKRQAEIVMEFLDSCAYTPAGRGKALPQEAPLQKKDWPWLGGAILF